ncbi:MAG: ribokinase [Subtercola sp.]|nr:ribokinase [Subtercola sp.]
MTLEVLCVGVATVDTITTVTDVPSEDQRIVGDPFTIAGGGPAATAAVTLARLGIPVGFCGVVGDDRAGETAIEQLEAEGVNTRWVERRRGERTTQSFVMVTKSSGARTIVTSPSLPPAPDARVVETSRWLHLDQTGFASGFVHEQTVRGRARVSLDAGNPIASIDVRGVDLYVPTASALARDFPGVDLRARLVAARAAGAEDVVVTAGAAGSAFLDGDRVVEVPPLAIEPFSTIGAGDVFHGALLAGLVLGRSMLDSVRLANVVAALSCRSLDGRSGIPSLEEADAVLPTFVLAPHTPLLSERN